MDTQAQEEFGQFMAGRWPGLVRLAYGLTGDRWLAEDIAQSALATAYAAWWRVSRADDPDAYVRRILINTSNRRFRRRNGHLLPSSGLFSQDSSTSGVWVSPNGPSAVVASGKTGSGTFGGTSWQISMTLGPRPGRAGRAAAENSLNDLRC
jgi:DNA-directed RNA polymerase specialized sigma24 family protein